MEYDIEQMTAGMIKQQAVFREKAVLEIGCGRGGLSVLLAEDTKQYIGIDTDADAIREARENHDAVDFRVGRGEALGFEDSVFDLVLFTLSLHHQDSAAALEEAYRVLKSTGRVVIVEPSVKGEFQQFFHLFDDETQAIQKAYASMMQSAFMLKDRATFDAVARFEDKADLCAYDFDRKGFRPGDETRILNKLDQLQPGASERSPILLKDTLDIYLLAGAG